MGGGFRNIVKVLILLLKIIVSKKFILAQNRFFRIPTSLSLNSNSSQSLRCDLLIDEVHLKYSKVVTWNFTTFLQLFFTEGYGYVYEYA